MTTKGVVHGWPGRLMRAVMIVAALPLLIGPASAPAQSDDAGLVLTAIDWWKTKYAVERRVALDREATGRRGADQTIAPLDSVDLRFIADRSGVTVVARSAVVVCWPPAASAARVDPQACRFPGDYAVLLSVMILDAGSDSASVGVGWVKNQGPASMPAYASCVLRMARNGSGWTVAAKVVCEQAD